MVACSHCLFFHFSPHSPLSSFLPRLFSLHRFTVNTVNPISVSFSTTNTVTATPQATFGTTNGQPFEGDPADRPSTGC